MMKLPSLDVASELLQFHNAPPSWVLALVITPLIAGIVFLCYRKPVRPRVWRRVLAMLRLGLMAIAVFLLLGPFLRSNETKVEPAPLALLYDDTASLQRVDDQQGQRLEVLKQIAASPERQKLAERYNLNTYKFSSKLSASDENGNDLTAQGESSAIGDSILELLSEYRGRRLPEIVLFSDGRVTQGSSLEEVAQRLNREGVRAHAVALGDPRPAPDLVLERVQVPDLVLVGDAAVFQLRVRGNLAELPRPVHVTLYDQNDQPLDRVEVDPWHADGVQVSLSTVMERTGDFALYATVDVLDGELALDNNRVELPTEVKPARIRVLYVEGEPRWEYRYLKNRLLRSETRFEREIELRCWLSSATREFPQEASPGVSRLRRCPTEADELLDNFDLIIIGDVDPTRISPDPMDGQRFMDAVATFVQRGGGLLMLAGPRHNPSAYRGTPLEALLPVQLSHEEARGDRSFHATLPVPENPHPVTLLSSDLGYNQQIWQIATPLWWFQPVARLRPGAQAWLLHSELSNENGPYVLAASIYAPEGWVGWIGSDETWRWRFPGGESQLHRFWRSALRHLASTRLRGAQGRVRLDLDRSQVELGSFLTVEARIKDDAFEPLRAEDGVPAFLEGSEQVVTLNPVPNQVGTFRGRFRATELGPGSIYLTENSEQEGELLASARFHTILPSVEMHDTTQDTSALASLTQNTGGMLVQVDQVQELFDRLDGKERLTRLIASHDQPIDPRLLMVLFFLFAISEWLLRKRLNLS
jgi:hypothetical protein